MIKISSKETPLLINKPNRVTKVLIYKYEVDVVYCFVSLIRLMGKSRVNDNYLEELDTLS